MPSQSRGQKRVDDILDAAEELIAELGIEAITTNAIAERAGASVGSLYHFFPGKEEIVQALARRFAEASRQTNATAMSADAVHLPLYKLFKGIVMGQAQMSASRPAFSAVYEACCRDPQGLDAYREMHEQVVGDVERFLAARMPRMPRAQRAIAAQLSFNVVNGALHDARTMPRDRANALLREVQRMLVRYLEPLDERYGNGREARSEKREAKSVKREAKGERREG